MAGLERTRILAQVFHQSKNDDLCQEDYEIKNGILKMKQEVGSPDMSSEQEGHAFSIVRYWSGQQSERSSFLP